MIHALFLTALAAGDVVERTAGDTMTAVELNVGDTLRFTLRNGDVRTLAVEETSAAVLLTNLKAPKKAFHGGGTLYEMRCRIRVDGHSLTLRRFVPVQESLYEPLVINGMRLWFDGVRKVEAFLNDNHGGGVPRKDVRFALQDAALPLCPQELRPWYPNPENRIDAGESYNANDVWMGPYQGADLHGGLDINMPIGTPLWAPMDFDTQFYFNSLKAGHNNNRWRGIRIWPNGQRWVLQAHHLVKLLVPENTPLKQNTYYATTAGTLTGSHAHSHFVFKIGPENDEILLDAWILFREIFENNQRRAGAIRASIAPLRPAKVGEGVSFSSSDSRPGPTGNRLAHTWTFGDGGASIEANPTYVYAAPGIYPVTLVVDDGAERVSFTQHLTVSGPGAKKPGLHLSAPEELAFRRRPAGIMDVYGAPVRPTPHTLRFVARPRSQRRPPPRFVRLPKGAGPPVVEVRYREGSGWLKVTAKDGTLAVQVDAGPLKNRQGYYRATVSVDCPEMLNSPQVFGVRLDVPRPRTRPATSVTVDNEDPACEATPWFWLSPQFHRHFPKLWKPGHRGSYLVNGGIAAKGEIVRFRPDLAAGTYRVALTDGPLFGDSRFAVRVRHRNGSKLVWMEPAKSREIGTFDFEEGIDGTVDILAEDSEGMIVADGVRFERK